MDWVLLLLQFIIFLSKLHQGSVSGDAGGDVRDICYVRLLSCSYIYRTGYACRHANGDDDIVVGDHDYGWGEGVSNERRGQR